MTSGLLIRRFAAAAAALSTVCLAALIIPGAEQSAAQDADLAKGKEIYMGVGACFSCHGMEGKGDGPAAATLNPKPRAFASGEFMFDTDGDGKKGTAVDLENVIVNGGAKYGGSALMVGRPDIAPADRQALVKYVMSLKH